MKINPETVYITDNGATYCGAHLGITARTTGRDLSGQRIIPVTPEIERAEGCKLPCERCSKSIDK